MTEDKHRIKGGAIILGSLFWEDEKNCVRGKEDEGKLRKNWRTQNLDCSKAQSLSLPTRYGRFSGWDNRRETYTMILSKEYINKRKMGTALAVPFKEEYDFSKKRTLNNHRTFA